MKDETSVRTKEIIGRMCRAALALGLPSHWVCERFGVSKTFLRKYADWPRKYR